MVLLEKEAQIQHVFCLLRIYWPGLKKRKLGFEPRACASRVLIILQRSRPLGHLRPTNGVLKIDVLPQRCYQVHG